MISIEDVISFFRETNPNKSEGTYTTMKYNIIRLEKLHKKDINDLSVEDFSNVKENMKIISAKYSLNTKIQTIMGIKLFLRFKGATEDLINKYNEELKKDCNVCKEVIEKNEMTDNEEKNWIDYINLRERLNQWMDYQYDSYINPNNSNYVGYATEYNCYNWVRNLLLLALYVYLPPTRIGNYQYMVIREQKKRKGISLDKKYNYIMKDYENEDYPFILIFNQYKTAKFIGQIEYKIDNDKEDEKRLITILKEYIIRRQRFSKKSNTHFLLNKDGNAMTQTNITDTLKYISRKIIGKELSVNLLRHIYITHFLSLKRSIEDNKKIAHFMGQTYDATQFEKYNKIKKKKEEEPINLEAVGVIDFS